MADDADNNFAANNCCYIFPIGQKDCGKWSASKGLNAQDALPVSFLVYPIFSVGYSRPSKDWYETGASTACRMLLPLKYAHTLNIVP
jgi:hypothetical protein